MRDDKLIYACFYVMNNSNSINLLLYVDDMIIVDTSTDDIKMSKARLMSLENIT